ncbi:unnamed protein product [Leptosia nina]|uniref:tRNA (uracil-O(2)-)-methyltransferase n=1 Tax=Leptosia nina TaxID=320188 RepID=A0AAV1J8J9_9NEOP
MTEEYEILLNLSNESFWEAIYIFIKKPHLVNKRLWGCNILEKITIESAANLFKSFENLKIDNIDYDKICKKILVPQGSDYNHTPHYEVLIVELLPKNYEEKHAYHLVIVDRQKTSVAFYDITKHHQNLCPNFTYDFTYNENKLLLKTYAGNPKSTAWLKDTVLPQIVRWAQDTAKETHKKICKESLSMIAADKYYVKYNELKIKYGKNLVKIWPECTDPSKFVYEDVAIATYLLLLWEDEESQSFVDVGCGNGLLVYILTMEGYQGVGVDVRRRKIWEMYPKTVVLEETTVTPSNISSFSKYKWIIGNHSDELTPWIPIITALGSYNNKFFLLPCCAFNIDGTKYKRKDSSKSQYTEYLEYVQALCKDFGFDVHVDRLKIPSTKRICLVSKKRIYPEQEYESYCNYIKESLKTALRTNGSPDDFKTREKVERVRNCTQINKSIIDSIVKCVSNYLLAGCNKDTAWTEGREVEMSDIVKLIPADMLKVLKSECGGLQTLLRNNHHIFKVVNGKVQFRYPKTIEEVQDNIKNKKSNNTSLKTQVKPCWFFNNHPHGCPLSKDSCSFLHVYS